MVTVPGCDDDRKQDQKGGGNGIAIKGTGGDGNATRVDGSGTGTGQGTGTGNEIVLPPDGTDGTGVPTEEPCDSIEVDLRQPPTKLMLVLDKSGSMVSNQWDHDGDPATAEVTRWFSLHEVVDQVTQKFNSSISFGAQLFPAKSAQGGNVGACAMDAMPEVSIAAQSRDAILAAIPPKTSDNTVVRGATPTYAAYASSLSHLLAVHNGSTDKSKKDAQPPAIVLVTDGGANCGQLDDAECLPHANTPRPPGACIDKWFNSYDDRIHAAVSGALSEHKVKTYVIGIGIQDKVASSPTVNAHEKLELLAEEGGTARTGAGAKYFSADNQKNLLDALDEIAASVRSCTVTMDTPVPEDRRDYVDLRFSTGPIPALPKNVTSCEGQNGWRWDHSNGEYTALELCGTHCETLKTIAAVDVEIGCAPPK